MSAGSLAAGILLSAGIAQPVDHQLKSLEAIAVRCHLPAVVFHRDATGDVHFTPAPNASFADVNCALKAARAAHLYNKMAFIGQETYEPEKN